MRTNGHTKVYIWFLRNAHQMFIHIRTFVVAYMDVDVHIHLHVHIQNVDTCVCNM